MSTTVYRPTSNGWSAVCDRPAGVGHDGTDYRDRPSVCADCDATFPNLGDLFAHDCPAASSYLRAPGVQTTEADNVDPRYGSDGRDSRGRRSPRGIVNRYEGDCAICGQHVTAGAGRARKIDGRWLTVCGSHVGATDQELRSTHHADQTPDAPDRPCRPNKYAGECRHCGGHVEAGAGYLCRGDSGWLVEHTDGGCDVRTPAAPVADAGTAVDVPAGHYAIPSTGRNDLAFYRVDRPTEGAYAGRTFVKLMVGGHPDRNVPRAQVPGILARIAADPEAAARYGREVGRCCRCNRTLTDEASRRAGIGPDCAAAM